MPQMEILRTRPVLASEEFFVELVEVRFFVMPDATLSYSQSHTHGDSAVRKGYRCASNLRRGRAKYLLQASGCGVHFCGVKKSQKERHLKKE